MFKRIILEYVKEGILQINDKEKFEQELKNSDLNETLIITKESLVENSGQHLEITTYVGSDDSDIRNIALENMEEHKVIADIDIK